ncbi:SDR family NAD(P)-dependent oxidoreductase [Pseudoalteromonas sp. SCSIO 43095]|uniref:SDR family NAD(P)-dependent oxidoreductase n=1 Tax=unclassified Pseudoalteromonas TaxID=194690 RepID=UPI00110A817C|nr:MULTISPECIES: SDR family NAD(P)-dependent oxidoreductase [unclassified Pseudoalteromonas]MCK8137052.1 SDR family NAD(P)-dependent oxidoreductase [Pseudoalteromonas sp. 2CM28B]TMP54719.1 3-oxoacyl-ACP reductase [Pseudoalteromonas sp. S1612]URQ99022.1 SDR family NAD(P)-dependent oxidoreductase [Pseudoalteromonas sp. SCSIO 43095]
MEKTVIVTGTGKGLGLALCHQLLTNDYKVIAVSRTLTEEFKVLQLKHSDKLFFYEYDFSDTTNISKLVKKITTEHGRPYGLINNAAIGNDGVLGTMHESDIAQSIKVNIEAPILFTKYVSRAMLLNKAGRIINVGSIIGSTGFSGLSVYGATKSALGGFTKSLARELGKVGITVNTLAPGYMETSMTDGLQGDKLEKIKRRSCIGRLASVDDAASAALYLLSANAAGVTGTTLTVDAGSTA